ncbi:MAG: glycosyltransferase family 2 protein [Chlamydiae bacterium]|nr:glycosyltransferase family 2 protein [Chlamydiota bacterium]
MLNNDQIKLSICIPTYNRAPFLKEALESIIPQINESVEIVISDNCSEDNSQEIINMFKKTFKNITYFRFDQNMGPSLNFLNVIKLAKGEYCWFLGSDDRIELGGIDEVLNQIRSNPQVAGFTVNYFCYDFKFTKKIPSILYVQFIKDTFVSDLNTFAKTLFHGFGFISSCVIKKSLWDKIINEKPVSDFLKPYLNAYVHFYIIGNIFLENQRWLYISKCCVGWRSANDSFISEQGFKNRLKIDTIGYEALSATFFGRGTELYFLSLRRVASHYLIYHILGVKLHENIPLKELIKICGYPYNRYLCYWYRIFPLILAPCWSLKLLRYIFRFGKKLKFFS